MYTRLRNRLAARSVLARSRWPYAVETTSGPIVVLPGVLDPVATKVGAWLAEVMPEIVVAGEHWVDMGSGTGIVGIAMATRCTVTAIDIDAEAVRNTRLNAILRGAPLSVLQRDLLGDIVPDGVVYNVPFWPGAPKAQPFAQAMYAGEHFQAITRYARVQAKRVLVALSEAGPQHPRARAAFGPALILRRERVAGEVLLLLERTSG